MSALATVPGLTAAYGLLAGFMGRFLYPARRTEDPWTFVARAEELEGDDSVVFTLPSGEPVSIVRTDSGAGAEDFVALSSTCPHLGCKVHWEAQNDRFFCPCHNGVFTPDGVGIAGPPGDAGQSLARYPLRLEEGILFIQAPVDALSLVRSRRRGERA